jgi:nitric oxide reductase activation protein
MSWDEALFGAAWTGARRLLSSATPDEVLARRVDVEPERARLEALARLLSGRPVTVTLTDDAPGIAGDALLVPRVVDFAPTPALNRDALVVHVAWALTAAQLEPGRTETSLVGLALLAPRVRAAVVEAFPPLEPTLTALERAAARARVAPPADDVRAQALEALVRRSLSQPEDAALPAAAWTWARGALEQGAVELPPPRRGWFMKAFVVPPVPFWSALLPRPAKPAKVTAASDDERALPGGTELKKKKATRAEHVQEPEQQLQENPLVHSFEKVHTLEEYKGGSKRIDGDDELAAHQKALDELDLRQVVRSHQRAGSLYRADVLLDGAVGDVDDALADPAEALYDEWDEGAHAWKRAWCRLTTRVVEVVPGADAQVSALRARLTRTTEGLRAVFEQLEASRAWKLRQRTGTDVDIDALVARYGALKAGECSESRLYATRRRHSRDTAVLLLLDASLSTDAWVANRRVLDVEKEAVLALGDALDGLFDEVAVAAFCSQTRRDCRFLVAKGFPEPWSLGAQRLASLEPHGFTRIGPAIRHATSELLACGAKQKLLLLVSDGKPSDVDRYEGRYGVADVHRAVLDAQGAGVVTHALAVDPAARAWLPSMFGHGRASVVSKPDDLVNALAKVTSTALRR